MSGSVAGSVATGASQYSHLSSHIFMSIPKSLHGNLEPFYESIYHDEELGVEIEEEALPSKKEFEALLARDKHPVHKDAHPDDENNANGDDGTFVIISNEDIRQFKVKDLQEYLKNVV
eukprot:2831458-Ditylum_brightwellii.AAC.1